MSNRRDVTGKKAETRTPVLPVASALPYGISKSPKSSILNENMCAGVWWSDHECAGMDTRIFRPDAIPTIRYMIRRDSFSFATLDIIPALDEDGWKPMKSNHSVRVQSESIR